MARMSMIVRAEDVTPDEFLIHIAHDPHASYSRAVGPRAMREAREHLCTHQHRTATWALTEGPISDDAPFDITKRCNSSYRFIRRET